MLPSYMISTLALFGVDDNVSPLAKRSLPNSGKRARVLTHGASREVLDRLEVRHTVRSHHNGGKFELGF